MTDVRSQPLPAAPSAGKSLAEIAASLDRPTRSAPLSSAAWVKIGVVAVLFALVNRWQFHVLLYKWRTDANWSHGFIIPLFSLYLLYTRWGEILAAPRRSSLLGLAILVLGLAGSALGGFYFRNNWLSHASLVAALFGLTAYLAGWGVMRLAWLPVVFLILGMPLSDSVYDGIALPLQGLAASASGALLRAFGASVSVDALRLSITGRSGTPYALTVAEACSGVRSMMAFVALSVAWAYITDRPWWQRLVLVLASIPVTVACNILRVTLTGTMYVIDKPEFGEKIIHELMGVALLVPALGLLMLLSKLLSSLFVEVDEEDLAPAEAPAARPAAAPQASAPPGEGIEAAQPDSRRLPPVPQSPAPPSSAAQPAFADPAFARAPVAIPRNSLADRHFIIAAAILAVTAGGWTWATEALHFTAVKNPVPWGARSTVSEDFRLTSLAEEMGPFKRVLPDVESIRGGPSFRNWELFTKTDLESLKIGTDVDKTRLADRRSNWYVSRIYRDTRPAAAVRAWRLDVYYYTGEADTVPHIPEICAQASGATILGGADVLFAVPAAPAPWAQSVPFRRTQYRLADGKSMVDYYTFSMNGAFSDSRGWVRWELLSPLLRHAYFAKIQFSPVQGVSEFEDSDRSAEEFIRYALPEVLKALPSSQDVAALEAAP
jgi:exosortase